MPIPRKETKEDNVEKVISLFRRYIISYSEALNRLLALGLVIEDAAWRMEQQLFGE